MKDTCGAKTRSGGECKKPPLNGKTRCRLHGGLSTGNQKAEKNTNAVKHGFYSDALLPEEHELWERVEIGSVDDEIRLAKIKLHRFVKLSGSNSVAEMIDGALEVMQKQGEDMRGIPYDKREIKVAAPSYADLIIRQLDLISKLEMRRLQMQVIQQQIERLGSEAGNDAIVGYEVEAYEEDS